MTPVLQRVVGRILVAGVSAVVLASMAPGLLATPAKAGDVAQPPDSSEVAYAVGFRTDMGFRHDQAFVLDTYANPAEYPEEEWGLPLSSGETLDLQQRSQLRALEQPAVDYSYQQNDFGGLWFDQTMGGKAFFRFTANLRSHADDIAARMPQGAAYEVLAGDYSWNELYALKERITDDLPALSDAGITVDQVAADGKLNKTVVSIDRQDPTVDAYLRARYGPSVATDVIGPSQDDTCTRTDCRPLKGGLQIAPIGYSPNYCSSGMLARKDTGTWVLVTAGHCVQLFGPGTDWSHAGDKFGTDGGDSLPSGSNTAPIDVGWIVVDSSETKTPANQYFAYSAPQYVDAIASNSFQQDGDTVCRSAATTGWRCGNIKDHLVSKPNGQGQTITRVWVMDRDASGGDSGGIMLTKTYDQFLQTWIYRVAGFHVHSSVDSSCNDSKNTCRGWYSTAEDFETPAYTNNASFSICLTINC